jgi:hypothetical protein
MGSTMNWKRDFDWDGAVKHHGEALKGIIAALFVMLGEATVSRIPKPLHRAVVLVLRPAESALRRLIVIAARGVVVKVAPSRPMPKGTVIGKGERSRLPAFQLYDTRKYFPELCQRRVRYAKYPPRIHFFGLGSKVDDLWPSRPPKAAPLPADGLVNGEGLSRRLQVLKLALDDLPRQARRMARWRLRRAAMPGHVFRYPLRPGPPPGHRKRQIHPIDEILTDCHALAWHAMKPDTS